MIDPRLLRDDPDRIRASQRRRGGSEDVVDRLQAADEQRRSAIAGFERLRAEQKQLGKQVAQATGDERAELLARTKQLSAEVKAAEAAQTAADDEFRALMADAAQPRRRAGAGRRRGRLRRARGARRRARDFAAEGFEPRDHLELGTLLKAIDVERGAKVSGSRFYFLTGVGAMLEMALVQMAMERAQQWGFTPMVPPALVKPRAMEGTGFLGQAADDVYHLPADDLYLVGTSEVPLAAYHMRRDPRRRRRCRAVTPRSARASGARRARTARTPTASSGCTGSTRSRCSSTRRVEDSYAAHEQLLSLRAAVAARPRAAVPGHRRGRRRPGPVRDPQVRLRGVGARPRVATAR